MAFTHLSQGSAFSQSKATANWSSWSVGGQGNDWPADALTVIGLSTDNVQTTDGASTTHTSVTYGGISFTKVREHTKSGGAIAGGVTVSVWYAINDTGSTITNPSGTVVLAGTAPGSGAKTITSRVYSRDNTKAISVETTTAQVTTGADVGDLQLSSLPNREYLFVDIMGGEGATVTTITPTTNWSIFSGSVTLQNTTGGSAATNIGIRGQYRILTGTATGANDPTSGMGAVDHSRILVAFYESTPANNWQQPVDDTASLSDASGKDITTLQTETPAVVEARVLDVALTTAETLSLADSQTIEPGKVTSVDDTAGLADASQSDVRPNIAETAALADSQLKEIERGTQVDEALSVDDLIASLGVMRAADDSAGLADGQTTETGHEQPVPDTLSLADASVIDAGKVAAEPLGVADAQASEWVAQRNVDDTASVADVEFAAPQSVSSDSIGLADARVADVSQATNDAAAVADTSATSPQRSVNDTAPLADAEFAAAQSAVIDAAGLTDARTVDVSQATNDTVAVVDAQTRDIVFAVTGETIVIVDARSLSVESIQADVTALDDSATTASGRASTIDDPLSLSDNLNQESSGGTNISDSLSVTDATNADVVTVLIDAAALADASATQLSQTVIDALLLADQVVRDLGPTQSETILITDVRTAIVSTTVDEVIALAEDVQRALSTAQADSASIADVTVIQIDRSVLDALALDDSVQPSILAGAFELLLEESVGLADSWITFTGLPDVLLATLTIAPLEDIVMEITPLVQASAGFLPVETATITIGEVG